MGSIFSYSEDIWATGLATVTLALNADKVLVEGALLAVVHVLGLANFEVFLALACPLGSRFLLVLVQVMENTLLFVPPFLLQLLGQVFGQRVDDV